MFLGTGTTSSVIHAAGASAGDVRECPNALVVLVKTKDLAPAGTASSSRFNVPAILVSTNSWRLWLATCGLCSVAVCRTTSTPCMHCLTILRSVIDPTRRVNGELLMSRPIASWSDRSRVRISASPKWPALPVTRILMAKGLVLQATALHCEHSGGYRLAHQVRGGSHRPAARRQNWEHPAVYPNCSPRNDETCCARWRGRCHRAPRMPLRC